MTKNKRKMVNEMYELDKKKSWTKNIVEKATVYTKEDIDKKQIIMLLNNSEHIFLKQISYNQDIPNYEIIYNINNNNFELKYNDKNIIDDKVESSFKYEENNQIYNIKYKNIVKNNIIADFAITEKDDELLKIYINLNEHKLSNNKIKKIYSMRYYNYSYLNTFYLMEINRHSVIRKEWEQEEWMNSLLITSEFTLKTVDKIFDEFLNRIGQDKLTNAINIEKVIDIIEKISEETCLVSLKDTLENFIIKHSFNKERIKKIKYRKIN